MANRSASHTTSESVQNKSQLLKGNQINIKNAAKSSSGKNTDLNEVLYHFTSIWIEEKLMKKYINHGRSKMQGMYLKFPIFLITFDIIKEKELHQSIARFKTAKGRVKKKWKG